MSTFTDAQRDQQVVLYAAVQGWYGGHIQTTTSLMAARAVALAQRLPAGASWIASISAHRRIGDPCLVMRPRVILVSRGKHPETTLPGEQVAVRLVAQLTEGMVALDGQVKEVDELIGDRFRRHPSAGVITSLPGIGILLGAEIVVAIGGDMDAFGSAGRLASSAGIAPVFRDSGRI